MAKASPSSPSRKHASPARKLAAIMFTDIVGYTEMMGKDEQRAMAIVQQNREIHTDLADKFHGTLIKEMGDGCLISFDTASDAVQCACALQQQLQEYPQFKLRIGIHLGEIMVVKNDVFGDGVNIASRLQSIAEAGKIYVSEAIQKATRARADMETTDLGERDLKNVDYPVRVYVLKGTDKQPETRDVPISEELSRRDVWRAGAMYIIVGLLAWKVAEITIGMLGLSPKLENVVILLLILGFPVAVGMAWFYEMSPKGLVRIGSEASRDNPYSGSEKKPLTSNAYMGVLFATFLALFFIFPSKPRGPAAGMPASEASVAILPFVNSTGNSELDHYGMGLASEIRTQLAVNKQFDFISSMQATAGFINSNELPKEIGQKLGVTHILSGMYQGDENALQVTVELVEAGTGKLVWSLPYKSRYQDLFSLRSSIGERVMERFNGKNAHRPPPTANMEAFAEYIRGQDIVRESNLPQLKMNANVHFENAIRLDSGFLQAWVELFDNHAYYYFNRPTDTVVTVEKIRPLIDYIEANFEDSWEKNEARGTYAYWVEKDYDKGERLFLEVLEENPDAVQSNALLQAIYRRRMEYQKALQYGTRVTQILNAPQAWLELGFVFKHSGDNENAERAFKKEVELNSQLGFQLYALKRQFNELEDLPAVTKERFGKTYVVDSFLQGRDYAGMLQFVHNVELDITINDIGATYFKALGHHLLKQDDSAKHYARSYNVLREQDPNGLILSYGRYFPNTEMNAILGIPVNSRESFNAPEIQINQDLQQQIIIAFNEMQYLVFSGDYEKATQKLRQINSDFPNWGWYSLLGELRYDRIKEEYPPFQEAIDNLKLPPLVSETNVLKM